MNHFCEAFYGYIGSVMLRIESPLPIQTFSKPIRCDSLDRIDAIASN